MVIDHPSEIEKKEEVNNFAINMAKNGNNKDGKTYNGALIKRKVERD
jgi:serine/threonine-protein kinase ULK/ATG1